MKKVVWENKSNGQLCVTIPKGSGMKVGDIVSLEKEKIKRIVYTTVAADLFHYGQLQFLEKANTLGDFHICGVLTDAVISQYKKKQIANFSERKSIVSGLRCVDMVISQNSLDPSENLKNIQEQFHDSEIIVMRGDNKEEIPGEEYVKRLKWKVIRVPYYQKLSDKKIEMVMGSS